MLIQEAALSQLHSAFTLKSDSSAMLVNGLHSLVTVKSEAEWVVQTRETHLSNSDSM